MSKAPDQVFDHEYDGILEYDNPLPRWWLWLFYGTMLWAAFYVPYYHVWPGLLPEQAYEEDMRDWYALHPQITLAGDDELSVMAQDGALRERGKGVFATRCSPCHAPDGGGLVGPNLTDEYWIHGGSMGEIVRIVVDGVPEKGMLSWKSQLPLDEIYAVSAFVHGLRGTTPANPKAPQGDKRP